MAAPVAAQPAPIVGTTVRTTDTSASSLCVGGASGCASATGGIKAGVVDTGLITSGGAIGIANNVPGVTTMKLYNNAGTLSWNGSPLSVGGSTVSGTIGKLAKFTGAAAVGDSICSEAGTTITCVNTVSATTLTGTLSTVSQPNVTTMAGLTTAGALVTVGTIGSGTWQGTIIDLARGGAGVSLSATGGTSQFLRQNGAGSTITVVRPAVSDLSDASNVALLNASNTFSAANPIILGAATKGTLRTDVAGYFTAQGGSTGFRWYNNAFNAVEMELTDAGVLSVNGPGDHTFSAATASRNALFVTNTTSGTTAQAQFRATAGTTVGSLTAYSQGFTTGTYDVQASTVLASNGAGGISIAAPDAAGTIRIYTGSSGGLRWTVDASGHLIPNGGATFNIGDSTNTIKDLYVGGVSYHADGSVGSPSLTFINDTNLGLYRVTTDVLGIQTAGALRWGVNAAGDLIFGASSHIADSSGTPAITSGGGTGPAIVGNDYAFKVTTGSTGSTTFTVTFGHTFTNTPIVVFSSNAANATINTLSTSAVSVTYDSTISTPFWFIVRGY